MCAGTCTKREGCLGTGRKRGWRGEANPGGQAGHGRGAGAYTPGDAESARASSSPLSTILDLAYCLEVEAMVTASRDSTVKVWEADWQLRMVFMGHTGAPYHRSP